MFENTKKVTIISERAPFIDNLIFCLEQDSFKVSVTNRVKKVMDSDSYVIFNLLNWRENANSEIDLILQNKVKKVILLEDAGLLYLNSHNKLPYSVYTSVKPKNKICQDILDLENKIVCSDIPHVIFRISEIYGPTVNFGMIHDLIRGKIKILSHSQRDFVYEGDVIYAIEIALKNGVTGIFDIANGTATPLTDLIDIINEFKKKNINVGFRSRSRDLIYNPDNFKFYKWIPLVGLRTGLQVTITVSSTFFRK